MTFPLTGRMANSNCPHLGGGPAKQPKPPSEVTFSQLPPAVGPKPPSATQGWGHTVCVTSTIVVSIVLHQGVPKALHPPLGTMFPVVHQWCHLW